jgi:hypothetical protein
LRSICNTPCAELIAPRVQPLRKALRPGPLPSPGGLKQRLAFARQAHEPGAAVMRIVLQGQDTLRREFVDDALDALPLQTHGAGEPRDRFRGGCQRYGSEHLPTRTGQAEVCDEIVSGRNQAAVQPEHFQGSAMSAHPFRPGAVVGLQTMTSYFHIDNILSIWVWLGHTAGKSG